MIEDKDLDLLLERKREYIGKSVAFDSILSALSFLVSVLLASYEDFLGIPGILLKCVFCVLGILFTFIVIWKIHKSKKNQYTHKDLLKDISDLNRVAHKHSIVVIRDTFNEYANRYLVYDDKKWNCKFFINYKDNINNESFVIEHLSRDLKTPTNSIKLDLVTEITHSKFSESHGKNKTYAHKFYSAVISDMPEHLKKDSFEIDGKKYYWLNMNDLESDEDVRKKNMDIVNEVKANF